MVVSNTEMDTEFEEESTKEQRFEEQRPDVPMCLGYDLRGREEWCTASYGVER
jgi:hypothetical protein